MHPVAHVKCQSAWKDDMSERSLAYYAGMAYRSALDNGMVMFAFHGFWC